MVVGVIMDARRAASEGKSTLTVLTNGNLQVATHLSLSTRLLFWATNAPYWHNRVTRESRWTPPSPTTPQDAMQRPQQTIPRAELAPVDSAPAQTHRLQQDGSPAPPLEAVQPADSASTFVAASVALPPPSTKSGPGTATVVAMDSPPGGPGDAATQSPRPPHIPVSYTHLTLPTILLV